MSATPPPPRDAPPVAIHPPVLFAVVFACAFVADRLWPISLPPAWPWHTDGYDVSVSAAGWAALLLGLAYMMAAVMTMLRARTGIPTFRPATALVTGGVFRITRNPIYVGLVLFQAAVGLLLANAWLLILLVPTALVLHYGVVRREEAYLVAKFGQPYRDYTARTRRY